MLRDVTKRLHKVAHKINIEAGGYRKSEGAGTFGEVTSREVTGLRQECDKVLQYFEALFFCLYS